MYIEVKPSTIAANIDTVVVKDATTALRNEMKDKWGDNVAVVMGQKVGDAVHMEMDVIAANVARVMNTINTMAAA